MTTDQIKGGFEKMKGKIKEKWGELTDNEIESIKGDWQTLKGLIQEKYGMAKDKAEEEVNNFLKSAKENTKENIDQASEAIINYIKKKPVTSVLAALATGLLLSFIIRS